MSSAKAELREFVYLDWERVRSLAAQLFEGIPETSSDEKGREVTVGGHIEGAIPAIIKAKGGADYRYFRTGNETRSLHHYVYTLVEKRLLKDDLITVVGADFDSDVWDPTFFRDGQFVRLTGVVRIMDYDWVSTVLDALPRMLKIAHHAALHGLQQRDGVTQQEIQTRKKEYKDSEKDLENMRVGQITELIRQLYGGVIRIKVLPDRRHPERVFVGAGDPANFNDTVASLSQKYGYEVDADWVTLGQVNVSTLSSEPLRLPTGNEMEDAFEDVALSVNDFVRVASAPRFPAISFTPISVYRTC